MGGEASFSEDWGGVGEARTGFSGDTHGEGEARTGLLVTGIGNPRALLVGGGEDVAELPAQAAATSPASANSRAQRRPRSIA